ncbi:MAG: hypothetical protein DRP35_10310 [Candidatus Zixiibacteriota bacterium]|nr:MAG: hypothetical protein DRP35_10310 [candidate division Zixibacteria bacterium]
MKSFKVIGIIILGMIILFFIYAIFLPNEVVTEKEVEINAPVETVYDLVNDFHQWQNWSPWFDTAHEVTYVGADKGVGAVMRWVDDKDKVGERSIKTSDFPNSIIVVTQFREEHSTADMTFEFSSMSDQKTKLTLKFKMESQFSYPFGRYIAWLIQAGVDNSFPRALVNIKDYAEKEKSDTLDYKVIEEEFAVSNYLLIKDSSAMEVMDKVMGKNFGQIMNYIKMSGLEVQGAPVVFWQKFNPQGISVFWAAMPVNEGTKVRGRVENFKFEGGKVCKIEYFGAYDKSAGAWNTLDKYIADKGYTMNGAPFEQYITDPVTEPDTTKWQTNIYFPVK